MEDVPHLIIVKREGSVVRTDNKGEVIIELLAQNMNRKYNKSSLSVIGLVHFDLESLIYIVYFHP